MDLSTTQKLIATGIWSIATLSKSPDNSSDDLIQIISQLEELIDEINNMVTDKIEQENQQLTTQNTPQLPQHFASKYRSIPRNTGFPY